MEFLQIFTKFSGETFFLSSVFTLNQALTWLLRQKCTVVKGKMPQKRKNFTFYYSF